MFLTAECVDLKFLPELASIRWVIHNSEIKLFVPLIGSKALSNLLLAVLGFLEFFSLDRIIFMRVGLHGLFPTLIVISG